MVRHAIVQRVMPFLIPKSRRQPILGDRVAGGPADSDTTFIMVCRTGFNAAIPNANATLRYGFCRGFAQIGIGYRLVSVFDVAEVLQQVRNPIVFLTNYDYVDLDRRARRALRDVPHFVWVNPWFKDLKRVYREQGLPDPRMPSNVIRKVFDSQPTFVFAIAPPSALGYYEGWQQGGMRVESVPLACDTTQYYAVPDVDDHEKIELAFVGGYRPYKNQQYEKYLRPYADRLAVFGYDQWPYPHYGGQIETDQERALYQNAKVCPALSEPHAELMGDIVERAYKVMGCRGLAIADCVPFYRDLFSEEELLLPRNMDEYHELVNLALTDSDFNERYRASGYEAVLSRHTYAHRAQRILDLIGHRDAKGMTAPPLRGPS